MLPGGVFSEKYATELAFVRTHTQWFWLAIVLIVYLVFIPWVSTPYWLAQFTHLSITAIIVLGLHILFGLCGLISIGQAAFQAAGAYTLAIMASRYDVNGWLALPLCILAGGIWGMIFGLPALRLKGFYLAIATLASFEITMWIIRFRSWDDVTGGFTGISLSKHPLTLGSIDFSQDTNMYLLAAVMVVIASFITLNIQRSNTGRIFVAIRDNELAAEVSGINIYRNKLLAYFIGCSFAGLAGWLYAYSQQLVNPSQYNFADSIFYLGMIIIGGRGRILGVYLGVFFIGFMEILNNDYVTPWFVDHLPERWSNPAHVAFKLVLGGLGMVLFLKYVPSGLAGQWQQIKLWYRSRPYSFWRE